MESDAQGMQFMATAWLTYDIISHYVNMGSAVNLQQEFSVGEQNVPARRQPFRCGA
jgi:hypothetical protein